MPSRKPILVLDFDGVLHSYQSGWRGATVISDPPVYGMVPFLRRAVDHFDVQILSSRSYLPGGIDAMQKWINFQIQYYYDCVFHAGAPRDFDAANEVISQIKYPTEKPAAFVTIDDRAIQFDGFWPSIELLKEFQPWNKRTSSSGSIVAESLDAPLTRRIRTALRLIFRWGPRRHASSPSPIPPSGAVPTS